MIRWLCSFTLEWRNWQTHGTQNPAPFTGHVGSTPTSSTKETNYLIGYRKLVNLWSAGRKHAMILSMSRPTNPYDNASCESFLKTLKREEIYANEYRDLEHL